MIPFLLRSTDSHVCRTQIGACIVNPEKKIVGIGYNGMPRGCDDDMFPWTRSGATSLDTKYPVSIVFVETYFSSHDLLALVM